MSHHTAGLNDALCVCVVVVLLGVVPVPAHGQPREVTGMLTEISVEHGAVEVRPRDGVKWEPARPLMALRPGDAVQATEDAWAIVVMSGSLRSVRIDATSSPFVVSALPVDAGPSKKAALLVRATLDYLSGRLRDRLAPILVTRGEPRSAVIVGPRNCAVLPGPLVVEWSGMAGTRATVRILGDSTLLLERRDVVSGWIESSTAELGLGPRVQYRIRLHLDGSPVEETWFEVVDHEWALGIQQDLVEIQHTLPPDTSTTSLAIIKTGHLMRLGLLHDARLVLSQALVRAPDEPAIHVLMGDLYASSGLGDLAVESYQRARSLLARMPVTR